MALGSEASLNKKICVGLGNPGPRYEQNRHNAGFMLLDTLLAVSERYERICVTPRFQLFEIESPFPCWLLKPTTYMNLSGEAIIEFMQRFQVEREDLISNMVVCYDDLALPLGVLRWRARGSAGGQKGMGNIMDHLDTREVQRLRLGIGSPPPGIAVTDYVLGDFCPDESQIFKKLMGIGIDSLVCWAEHGISITMSQFNGLNLSQMKDSREE